MTTHSQVPTFDDRKRMWASLDFPHLDRSFPKVARFLEALRPLYANGEIVHLAFRLPVHPTLDWFLSRNQVHEAGFFERFWSCRSIKAALPYSVRDLNFFDQKVFSFCSPFLLGGSLAWVLSAGGAYRQFERGSVEAKQLGEEAAFEMLGGSFDHSLVYESGIAWSDFFKDVAWDHSYVVIEQISRTIHVLLASDTD